jgi:hypothetical protein
MRSGRPHLLKDHTFTACEALHVIQLVQCTSATVPVYANVFCPRADHTQLTTYLLGHFEGAAHTHSQRRLQSENKPSMSVTTLLSR